MKQKRDKWTKIIGWILFLFAVGFFCLQSGYLYVRNRYQVEYIDDRLFYIINIIWVICLFLAILLLLKLTRRFKLISVSIVSIFILVHAALLVDRNREIINITSVSPDFKQVFSIKENAKTGDAVYYRSYYGILGRPKEVLPNEIAGEYTVEWLANDIAAFTYQTADNTLQQFIGTYGERKNGMSYYYVGAEIQGQWQGDNIKVISNPDGIAITENKNTELFEWDNIQQFGTLAVVLKKNNEAVWTISLNENFVVRSDSSAPTVGNISLDKVSTEKNQPLTFQYKASN